MKINTIGVGIVLAIIVLGATDGFPLTSGTDVLVPAAGRGAGQEGSMWVTDLSVLNLGDQTTSVEVFWLTRNRANPDPPSATFTLLSGAALVLEDAILETFGLESGGGAFRVVSDTEVAVASRIYNLQGTVTFGQGFEGVPRTAAVPAGSSTDVASLQDDSRFRTNIVLIDTTDSSAGSSVVLSLRDEAGNEIAAETFDLRRLEPKLFPVADISTSSFPYATLHAEVISGSVIVAASKVDNDPDTGDPTTLEAWFPGPSIDGTYQFAIWDSLSFATGGNLIIGDGVVEAMTGTYINYDKVDGTGQPECTLLFQFGVGYSPAEVEEFESGVAFTDTYPEGGELTWTISFSSDDNLGFVGTIEAEGANFTGIDEGCNGAFPSLDFEGGKDE